MLEGWRENEARYVFSIVVGCHQSHFGDFMFCYDWFTRKLSKAKPLVVRPNRMMDALEKWVSDVNSENSLSVSFDPSH